MDELIKLIPMELTKLLSTFNKELDEFQKVIEMSAIRAKINYNRTFYDGVRIRYKQKNTNLYFEIEYIFKSEYISWKYYPYQKHTTKEKNRPKKIIEEKNTFEELISSLRHWKNNLIAINELENPLEYFKADNLIKFYAGEVLDIIQITELDKKVPLSSKMQPLILKIIEKQKKFIAEEISNLKDEETEKKNDLIVANGFLDNMKENISRMTVAEVKNSWAITFGAIRKWCGEKFLDFVEFDKKNDNDISRMIGSFMGGFFGMPKLPPQ
jgi:hypothetical protein